MYASTATEQISLGIDALECGKRVPHAALEVIGWADVSGFEDGFFGAFDGFGFGGGGEDTALLVGGKNEWTLKGKKREVCVSNLNEQEII